MDFTWEWHLATASLAPLNLNPELVHPKAGLSTGVWNEPGCALSPAGPLWRTLTSPSPSRAQRNLCPPVGKTGVVLLSFLCPAEFFYGEKGKGKISFLPIFLLPIAEVDLPLFSTCHVSSYSFPLPVSGDHGWLLARPPLFCWGLFQAAWASWTNTIAS